LPDRGVAAFLVRRALQAAAVVGHVVTLTFVLVHAAPGDPTAAFGADNPLVTQAQRSALRAAWHLDDPLPVQYLAYVGRVLRGDLGTSITLHDSVATVIGRALPNTLLLMGVAIAASFVLGIALGVLQGARRGTLVDRLTRAAGLALYSTPEFWLALLALLLLAYKLGAFPIGGMGDSMHDYLPAGARLRDSLRHLALPALTLTLANAAGIARFQRAALLDASGADYVRTARAKGLGERGAIGRHALRNALLPTITLAGLSLPALFGGAVFIERIFAWPGMGRLVFDALNARDYPVVTGGVIVAATAVCLGSLLADVALAAADPRLRAR
jgi:peptide/nickel transport system permease protein